MVTVLQNVWSISVLFLELVPQVFYRVTVRAAPHIIGSDVSLSCIKRWPPGYTLRVRVEFLHTASQAQTCTDVWVGSPTPFVLSIHLRSCRAG